MSLKDKISKQKRSYKIKFFDRARFMETSLSNLVDNLTGGIYKTKCKD